MRRSCTTFFAIALAGLLTAGAGCNEPDAPTSPDTGTPDTIGEAPSPVAEFTYEPQTLAVGQPVTLDASASEPVDESLRFEFHWTIDGAPAATGEQATHIFETPGEHTVELLVDNAGWKSTVERTIDVQRAPSLADGSARLNVRATDAQGTPLTNATLRVIGRDGATSFDSDGRAALVDLPTDTRITVVVEPPNAATRYETVVIPEGTSTASIDVAIRPVVARASAPITQATTVDLDGMRIEVPRRAFIDQQGQQIRNGEVDLELTRFVAARGEAHAVPGTYQAYTSDGPVDHRFFGGIDLRAYHNGEPARLAYGQTLEVVVPTTYPAAYEGLTATLLHLEPTSGYWLRTGEVVTALTDQSPTKIGATARISKLGAWALAVAQSESCDVTVRCQDADGAQLETCTVRANLQGIDGVGRTCEPSALTEGVRCQGDQNCVNCEQDPETVSDYVPSAPCYVSPQGNSVCPGGSAGGVRVGQRYCLPDEAFTCEPDPSGLGHCLQQVDPSCGMGSNFCDVHRDVTDTPTPSQGICTAPQSDFQDHEGIFAGRRITAGGIVNLPRGRLQLTAIGPDGELRGESDVLGRTSSCPAGPVTLELQ